MKLLRPCYLLVLFLLVAGLGSARAQTFAWARLARTAIDTSRVTSQLSATDAAGNTYAYASFRNDLSIDGTVLTTNAPGAAVVIKYDPTGAVVWFKRLQNVSVIRLAADNAAGGVFLVASQQGAGTWDGGALATAPNAFFYAKCSAAGALQWAQPLPTIYYGTFNVVADDAGSAYISGAMDANATVAGTSVNIYETFVLKTNGAGTPQWVRVLHGGPGTLAYVGGILGPKPGGGCVIGGILRDVLYLGAGTTTPLLTPPSSTYTGFVSSFDAAGTHQWTTLVGYPPSPQDYFAISAVAADASGSCYVTGTSSIGAQTGSGALTRGYFLAKYDAANGAVQWTRGQQAPSSFNDAGLLLAPSSQGVTVLVRATNPATQPLVLGPLTLRTYYNFVHYNAQGAEQWAVADSRPDYSPSTPITAYFAPSSMGTDALGNLYATGRAYPQQNRTGAPGAPAVVQLGAQTTVGGGIITTRINTFANTLRGQVYLDQNGNGVQDSGEGIFPRSLAGTLIQGSSTTYSPVGADGVLQAYATAGAYSLSVGPLPTSYTVSQPGTGAYAGTFSGSSQLVSGLSFGIAPIANQTDLRATLTAYSPPRAGFTTRYRLALENVGTTTVPAGTATLTLDALAQYVSSAPAGTAAGRVVSLSYPALAPFAQMAFDVTMSLPINTALGTALTTTAAAPVAGDVVPANNSASLPQTVVGSFDPNEIEVNYQRLTPTQVAAQQPLDYTIHFQNLGTASAYTVVVSDTLDFTKLNPATLFLVAQSHNCSWSLSSIGPNTGQLTVRFLNINLPERNVDVIRSQGFVRFRVQPRPTLVLGEVIPNRAGIVFDFNNPVRTNTATTTVSVVTAALASHNSPAWTAYPNPATDAVTIAADLATAGPLRLELLDVLGRPVRQQTLTAPAGPLRQTLDLRGLPAGLYLLRLTPPTGPASSQQVVRE